MQRGIQRLGLGVANTFDLLEVLDAGHTHGFDRTEMIEQPFLIALSNTRNLIERTAQRAFAALLAMVGDRESMRFVTYALQQVHAFGLAFEDDRIVIIRHPYLFEAFGQATDGHIIHAAILESLGRGHDLRFTAIDHHEIRLVCKVMTIRVLLDHFRRIGK